MSRHTHNDSLGLRRKCGRWVRSNRGRRRKNSRARGDDTAGVLVAHIDRRQKGELVKLVEGVLIREFGRVAKVKNRVGVANIKVGTRAVGTAHASFHKTLLLVDEITDTVHAAAAAANESVSVLTRCPTILRNRGTAKTLVST